jgi:hypothetical protein
MAELIRAVRAGSLRSASATVARSALGSLGSTCGARMLVCNARRVAKRI